MRRRNVSHVSTWAGKANPERSLQELVQARAASDEARFDLAGKLVEVEGRKRVDFSESVCCVMDAHVRFFERGGGLMRGVEPYVDHALQARRTAMQAAPCLQRQNGACTRAHAHVHGDQGYPTGRT